VEPLAEVFLAAIRDGEQAVVQNSAYLAQFGYSRPAATLGDLWRHLLEDVMPASGPWLAPLNVLLEQGPLARRIVRALGDGCQDPERLGAVYRQLCDCLTEGRMFLA